MEDAKALNSEQQAINSSQKVPPQVLQTLLELAVTRANGSVVKEDNSVVVSWNKRLKKYGLK